MVNIARRTRCEVHVTFRSMLRAFDRVGRCLEREKIFAFWNGTAARAPTETDETAAPTNVALR